jgi:oxaloacetate decarboxylase beta subunit
MLGNLFREAGVVRRLSEASQNALINVITIFLGLTVGATANAGIFLSLQTLLIIMLGLAAFCVGVVMYFATEGKVNHLIGSAGVSAVAAGVMLSLFGR